MGEPSREQLDEQAEALGLDPEAYTTKGDLQDAIDGAQAAQAALGPVVPPGSGPPQFDPQSNPNKGIQPLTADDLPEALR